MGDTHPTKPKFPMSHVEESKHQYLDLDIDKEQISQLNNLVDLLVDLQIIQPTLQHEPQSIEPLEKIICNAYLEYCGDEYFSDKTENLPQEVEFVEQFAENIETIQAESTNESNYVDTIAAFEKLQNILFGDELGELHNIAAAIKQNIAQLKNQLYNPDELISLLLPYITQLIKLKIIDNKEELVEAVTPIVDQVIKNRVEQDREIMGSALASAVPPAITQQIKIAPEEVAAAIAPTMGEAIKKQIEIEQDKIVDALYPVIGNTIAKYMGETIQAINQQIENTLSYKGIKRKVRAKIQGVSEAELILRDAVPFNIQAIFLIHKASGLVISDIQPSSTPRLESEMVAGMLTAIRSFANDCISQSINNSELNAIDYGSSKILLEVAGYCYIAIVIQGETPKNFNQKMRNTLSKIVKSYGKIVEKFDGDPEVIPTQIHQLLLGLRDEYSQQQKPKNRISPLAVLSLTVVSAVMIPWGVWQYYSGIIRAIENKTALALSSTPELAVYRLNVKEEKGKLQLTGRVPNQLLRQKAEEIARVTAEGWKVNNQIISVEIPADPVLAEAEVKRVTGILNKMDGVAISSLFINDKAVVEGTVSRETDASTIIQALEQIPGVKKVSSAVKVQPLRVNIRFYFQGNSAQLQPKDLGYKLQQVKSFLNQHPKKHLKIIGYSNSSNGAPDAQNLAIARAKVVKQALIQQGVEPTRLETKSRKNLPPGIDATQPDWLKRCVVLEPIDK